MQDQKERRPSTNSTSPKGNVPAPFPTNELVPNQQLPIEKEKSISDIIDENIKSWEKKEPRLDSPLERLKAHFIGEYTFLKEKWGNKSERFQSVIIDYIEHIHKVFLVAALSDKDGNLGHFNTIQSLALEKICHELPTGKQDNFIETQRIIIARTNILKHFNKTNKVNVKPLAIGPKKLDLLINFLGSVNVNHIFMCIKLYAEKYNENFQNAVDNFITTFEQVYMSKLMQSDDEAMHHANKFLSGLLMTSYDPQQEKYQFSVNKHDGTLNVSKVEKPLAKEEKKELVTDVSSVKPLDECMKIDSNRISSQLDKVSVSFSLLRVNNISKQIKKNWSDYQAKHFDDSSLSLLQFIQRILPSDNTCSDSKTYSYFMHILKQGLEFAVKSQQRHTLDGPAIYQFLSKLKTPLSNGIASDSAALLQSFATRYISTLENSATAKEYLDKEYDILVGDTEYLSNRRQEIYADMKFQS